jgi:hypothetical protein
LEIIEVSLDRAMALPDQPENWLLEKSFEVGSWKSVGHFGWEQTSLLLDNPPELWNDPASGPRRVKEGFPRTMPEPASLYFVKPEKIESIRVWSEPSHPSAGYPVKRRRVATIRYAGVCHECDIDDPSFAERYYQRFPSVNEPTIQVRLPRPDSTLVSLSVTGAFQGYHYKIAAAFFEPPAQNEESGT